MIHDAGHAPVSMKCRSQSITCVWRRSHEQTTARLRLVASKTVYDIAQASNQPVDKTNVYGHTKNLFDNAQRWMAMGTYKPVLDPATVNCQNKLSWWRD